MRKFYYLFIALIFIACNGNDTNTGSTEVANNSISPLAIEKMEKELFKDSDSYTDSLALKLYNSYLVFKKENPKDEMTPKYLFNAANISRTFKKYDDAINLYREILASYPNFEQVIESHFLIAFIYDNDLKDKDKARQVYEEVAAKYPNENFGKEAAMRLETIHLTDEELIQMFLEKNKEK